MNNSTSNSAIGKIASRSHHAIKNLRPRPCRGFRALFGLLGVFLLLTNVLFAGAVRPGFNANALPANDDGSTGLVPVGFDLNFFGVPYSQLYVNNNGNVTFNGPLSTFTPFPITTTNTPIIAPFFADVDTQGAGSDIVRYSYGIEMVDGHHAFGVNWVNVGYFSQGTDKLNSFQLVLIERPDTGAGDFDIELNYDKVQWEAGSASGGSGGLGGSAARAGYANGSATNPVALELNGSAVNGAFLDSNLVTGLIYNSLNSQEPGRYLFHVRNGVVTDNPPVANAGPDQTVNPDASVMLNGNGSYDPEGLPITYSWIQTAGPALTLTGATTSAPTFTAPSIATSLTFELTVSDGALMATDGVTIFVGGVPLVVTGSPGNITAHTADIAGIVNPRGSETMFHFEYGTDETYGSSTATQALPAGSTNVPVTAALSGLSGSTTYHYRIVATNGIGTAQGTDRSFTTLNGNNPPVAQADTLHPPAGSSFPIDVLANDSDTDDGDSISVTATTDGATGTVMIAPDGLSVTYTTGPGYSGNDSFTYTISDSFGATATATVTLTNLNPVTSADAIFVLSAPRTLNPLFNDTDADGDIPLVVTGSTDGIRGTVAFTDASLTYTPVSLGTGTDTFTYTVSDGHGGSALGTVKVYSAGSQAGFYAGFIDDAGGVDGASQITMSSLGKLTGRIYFGGLKYSFKGQLDENGEAVIQISRSNQALVILHLALVPGDAPTFLVSIEQHGAIEGTGEADRSGTNTPGKRRYTLLLPPDPAEAAAGDVPAGTGYATVSFSSKGKISIVGAMGDGARFSTASAVRTDNTFPFFAPIYGSPRGEIYGTMNVRDVQSVSDLDGVLTWHKPAQANPKPPGPASFTTTTAAIGSLYVQPKPTDIGKMLHYNATGDASVAFSEGNLASPLQALIHVGMLNPPTIAAPILDLTFTITAGRFAGNFSHPANGTTKFLGVVFQKQNRGAGFFIGSTESGQLDLIPQP